MKRRKAKTFGEFMLGLHSEYNNDAFTGRDKALAFAKRFDSKQGERWSNKEGGLFGQVVPVLDEVLEHSVLAYFEEDNLGGMIRPDGTIHKEHPNTLSFNNYVGKVNIDGVDHYVRMTIQHDKGNLNGMHSCFVTEIEIYENAGIQATGTENSRVKPYYSGIVDAKLQQFFERTSL